MTIIGYDARIPTREREAMSASEHPHLSTDVTSDDFCLVLESILEGSARRQILDRVLRGEDFEVGVKRLRSSMQTHVFRASSDVFSLAGMIEELDKRTCEDGFHVLQAWDSVPTGLARKTCRLL